MRWQCVIAPRIRSARWCVCTSGPGHCTRPRAAGCQFSPVEFPALLLEDELERRHQRTQARRQKEAGFEYLKALADFDFVAVPTLDKALVREMGTCPFVTAEENWLIFGPTGVGKSHLATGTGHEAIRRGMKVLSFATHRLLAEVLAARADGGHHKLLTKLTAVEPLITDDFGLRPISAQGAEGLYELTARRYEHGSISLTSRPRRLGVGGGLR